MQLKQIMESKSVFYVLIFGMLATIPFSLSKFWERVFLVGFYFMLLAISWDIDIGYTGSFNLANQTFSAVAAYTSLLMAIHWKVPLLIAIILGLGIAVSLSLSIGLITLKMSKFAFCLTTWVMSESIYVVLCTEYSLTGGTRGIASLSFFPPDFPMEAYFYLGLCVIIAVTIISEKTMNSRIGLYFNAIRDDEECAEVVGVDTFRFKILSLLYSSFIAGLAGIYFACCQPIISPAMASISTLITVIIMVILGGMGTIIGPIIGATLITVITEYFRGTTKELGVLLSAIVVLIFIRILRGGLIEFIRSLKGKYLVTRTSEKTERERV